MLISKKYCLYGAVLPLMISSSLMIASINSWDWEHMILLKKFCYINFYVYNCLIDLLSFLPSFDIGGKHSEHILVIIQEVRRRGLKAVIAGIPKTIDNDIPVFLITTS